MENEPLLSIPIIPTQRSFGLSPLPENDEVSIPPPMNPSELKDRLIFGSSNSPAETSRLLDALAQSLNSPHPTSPLARSHDFPPFTGGAPSHPQPTKKKFHRSKTAPAMSIINELNRQAPPKPYSGSQSVIRYALVLLIMYLLLGVVIYWFQRNNFLANETHPVVDAIYFCIVTMCTIGYGDITPNTAATKLFSIMFVLVGFGFIDILLSGMVSYVLDLQESYLLRAMIKERPGEKEAAGAGAYIFDMKKGRMRIRMKVALALGVVVFCIGVGLVALHFVEKLGWLDSFYLSVMSVTTVGYGDRAFRTLQGRIFASIWLLVSTLAVARAFLYLAEARVDKRQRRMAKWVLGHDMTVSEFLAADIDHNGFVRYICLLLPFS